MNPHETFSKQSFYYEGERKILFRLNKKVLIAKICEISFRHDKNIYEKQFHSVKIFKKWNKFNISQECKRKIINEWKRRKILQIEGSSLYLLLEQINQDLNKLIENHEDSLYSVEINVRLRLKKPSEQFFLKAKIPTELTCCSTKKYLRKDY